MTRSILGTAISLALLLQPAWGQTPAVGQPPAAAPTSPTSPPDALTPEEVAYRTTLLDELTNLQKLDFPVPVSADVIQNLTPTDLKIHSRLAGATPS